MPTSKLVQKAIVVDEKGRVRGKVRGAVYQDHKHEAMAPENHMKKGIKLVNPSDSEILSNADQADELDDDSMADKDEELQEHEEDLREPSQSDIQHSSVWHSTMKHESPPKPKRKRRHGRRPVRKPIPLATKKDKALPKLKGPDYLKKKVALRIIVLTMNRVGSLSRLLRSLREADYVGDRVDLDIFIDKPDGKPIDEDILNVAKATRWDFGKKTIHENEENKGLAYQWINAWERSVDGGLKISGNQETTERAVILEDDLKVSVHFWKWLKKCHDTYLNRPDFAGCTLQRASLCLKACPNLKGGPVPDKTNFMYPLVGSWGFSPNIEHWVNFRNWYLDFTQHNSKPYVPGLTPTSWYKQFEKQGRCPGKKCMWTMHHIKYSWTHKDKFCVYLKAPNGQTLATNYQEPGLHYKGKPKIDAPTLEQWSEELAQFSENPIMIGYNGQHMPSYNHWKKNIEMRGGKSFHFWQIDIEDGDNDGER
eukprot:Stramenopile-MAST_4_protein_97